MTGRAPREVISAASTVQTIVSAVAEDTAQTVSPTFTIFSQSSVLKPVPEMVSSESAKLIKELTFPFAAPFEIWMSVISAVRQLAKVNSRDDAVPGTDVAHDESANEQPSAVGPETDPPTIVSAVISPINASMATISSHLKAQNTSASTPAFS